MKVCRDNVALAEIYDKKTIDMTPIFKSYYIWLN